MAKIFNFIPSDIKTEIFSPIPVDSIIQCKCVCKTWRAFIDDELLNDTSFLDAHTRLFLSSPFAAASSHSFLARKRLSKRLNPFHIIGDDNDWNIVGSCNGLVCLVRTHEGWPTLNAYICNPVTGEYVKLTPQCDPPCYRSIFAIGFGYLPSTNEYKFVRITDHISSKNIQISVYILGKGAWDMIQVKDSYPQLSSREREAASAGLLFDGALYWSISPYGIIISFNLETEEFREVPSPPESRVNVDEIWVLGGCFCVIRTTSEGSRDIWVMNKEKEDYTWTMKFKIKLASMENHFPSFALEEKIVLSYDYMNFACCDSKLTSHGHLDLELNNSTTINSQMVDWFQILLPYISKFEMIPYARSLVSLRALGESADVIGLIAIRKTKPKTEDICVPLINWLESISCYSQKRFVELESNPQPSS